MILNSNQIAQIYFKLENVWGKLRKYAKSCAIVQLAKDAISATYATAQNFRGYGLIQKVRFFLRFFTNFSAFCTCLSKKCQYY